MQTVFLFLTSVVLFFSSPSEAPYSSLERAFTSNNAETIVALGKERMLLNVGGKEAVYSHSQAQLILKDFFTKKPCTNFRFIFKGKETGDGCFAIGTFESKAEEYRTTIHFKKVEGEFKIESLIIEKA
ncbi:MAG: DUF4783 domain-containing protein [Crocinitomicaceae bacterium]|nr:DUF4783 domain-containing protein [Crocinitomicaceae bacterium]